MMLAPAAVPSATLTVVGVLAGQLYLRLTRDTLRDTQIRAGAFDPRPLRVAGLWTTAALTLTIVVFVPRPGDLLLATVVAVGTLFHVSTAQLWLARQCDDHRQAMPASDG